MVDVATRLPNHLEFCDGEAVYEVVVRVDHNGESVGAEGDLVVSDTVGCCSFGFGVLDGPGCVRDVGFADGEAFETATRARDADDDVDVLVELS